MNGAESLIRTLVAGGVEVCFTNPGTSEMHIVAALDRQMGMRCVLGLFEGVVTGAADGYARMAGKPACTLVHLGPGFANGIANLHNASRARVPIVNIIGQHASYHLQFDTPLTSDIAAIARPYSKWLHTTTAASEIGRDAAEAILIARTAPGQIATMIVPADVAWSEGGTEAAISPVPDRRLPPSENIQRAIVVLRSGARTAILLAGDALYGKGLVAAGRIAGATNAKLLAPYPFTRIERGAGTAVVDRIPYVPELAADLLKEFRYLILVGAEAPVAYFASPGNESRLTSTDCEIILLAKPVDDCSGSLEALAADLTLPESEGLVENVECSEVPHGSLTPSGIAAAIAALLPENAIVVDESMTSGRGIMAAARGSKRHDYLANTGGSIGIAMPLAVGAAVACPTRRVLCLSADGSGMYTLQALWTMAREGLNITTVIFANRQYAVLKREFSNLGIGEAGSRASDLFEIGRPDLRWASLAKGMGVAGTRVASLDELAKALQNSYASQGPSLVEIPL